MNQSENIAELATALSKAQSEIQGAKKDCANPFFKSKYADLSSVWDACRDPLTKNGLCVIQTTAGKDGKQFLYTTLAHTSGQWMRSEMEVIVAKQDIQALGSSLTYCRRYSLSMMAGVCPEDDDANLACVKAPVERRIITSQQADYLESLLSQCPEAYAQNVKSHIAKAPISANSIRMLPLEAYENMKSAIESTIAKKKSEVVNV
jgi:hypothetical protein